MQAEFWQQRWARNEIGFHAKQVNDYLQRFWQTLQFTDAGADGSQILVPLRVEPQLSTQQLRRMHQ